MPHKCSYLIKLFKWLNKNRVQMVSNYSLKEKRKKSHDLQEKMLHLLGIHFI